MWGGTVRTIDFYRLPRPVQDRFAAATRGSAPPSPLLFRAAVRTAAWAWLGASAGLVLGAALLLRAGMGDASSALALHDAKTLAVDVVLLAGAAYGVIRAMGILRALEAAPYRPGMYVFPACAVDARPDALRVLPFAELERVEVVDGRSPGVALRARGRTFFVRTPSATEARRAERDVAAVRPHLARALAQGDIPTLAELDPLHDSALSSPIGPTEPMARLTPPWARFDWAIALAVGGVLALVVGTTRNSVSDEAMFRSAVGAGTVEGYQAYLARGSSHVEEVRDLLLPRAELQRAEAVGTVEAILDFAGAHPASKIGAEIDGAKRRAWAQQLVRAKQAGTVRALDEFARTYPDSQLEGELRAARHALYLQAGAEWRKQASPDAATAQFVDRLLAWAEKSGNPLFDVRFRTRPGKSIEDADKAAYRSGHLPGPDALPSAFFTVEALRTRESRLLQDIVDGFAKSFPEDVLRAQAAEPLPPEEPPPSAVPVFVIDDSVEWSRSETVSTKPNTVFANFTFIFEASFGVPDGLPPWKASSRAWRGAELWKVRAEGMTQQEFQGRVYDLMIDGAFDQLDKKLTGLFF
jgi:hypothetical protein